VGGGPWWWFVEFCGLYLLRLVWFVYECPRCEVWDYVVCEFGMFVFMFWCHLCISLFLLCLLFYICIDIFYYYYV